MHPEVFNVDHANAAFGFGTRPMDGRNPTTLQNAAGLRSDPPTSVPLAMGANPQASATAEPPDEPPQVFVRSYGLRVTPKILLKVCEPAPNSGVLDLPMVIAPARCIRSTTISSSAGNVIFIQRRAVRSANAARFQQVFVRDREAVQRAQRFAVRLLFVGFRRGFGGRLRCESHDRVYFGIHALDLFQMCGQSFARGEFLFADHAGHFDGAQETDGVGNVGHGPALPSCTSRTGLQPGWV